MNLRVSELRHFLKISSGITVNSILPVLAYLKLDKGYLVKSNLQTFVQHKITAPSDVSMLIKEEALTAFLKDCKSDEIEVVVEGIQGRLKEGKRTMGFDAGEQEHYPKFPESEKEGEVTLTSDVLEAIGVSAKNVATVGGNIPLDFVHLKDGIVFGTDGAKFYCKKIKGIPNMVLSAEAANTISQFDEVVYYRKGTYDFFQMGNTLYGFIQEEAKTPDIKAFIMDKCPDEYFEFIVSEFVGFCDTVASASSSKVLNCKIDGNKLSFEDADVNFDYNMELSATGKFNPNITFLPKVFGNFFKSTGCSMLKLAPSPVNTSALSVWDDDDPNFFSLIIGTRVS